MNRELLKQAIDVLKDVAQTLAWQQWGAHLGYTDNVSSTSDAVHIAKTAIAALEEELAKPEPEPVAWVHASKYKLPGQALNSWLSFNAQDENSLSAVPLYAAQTDTAPQTCNCSRHPDAPHGPDGAGCKCHSWAPGEAS